MSIDESEWALGLMQEQKENFDFVRKAVMIRTRVAFISRFMSSLLNNAAFDPLHARFLFASQSCESSQAWSTAPRASSKRHQLPEVQNVIGDPRQRTRSRSDCREQATRIGVLGFLGPQPLPR